MEGAHVLTRKPIDVTMLPKIVTFLQPNLLASALTTGPTKSNQIFIITNKSSYRNFSGLSGSPSALPESQQKLLLPKAEAMEQKGSKKENDDLPASK